MSSHELDRLEGNIGRLTKAVKELESRVASLESALGDKATAQWEAGALPAVGDGIETTPAVFSITAADIGRAFLVMAGAFMLRALTDASLWPQTVGIGLGLLYALLWIVQADRGAALGRAGRATLHGTTAALIAFPILWEGPTHFALMPPALAAGLLTLISGLALGVSARRNLRAMAWIITLGALLTSTALIFATGVIEPFIIVLLLLGLAAIWLGYQKKWHGLRWLTAGGADLMVIFMISVATGAESNTGRFQALSVPMAQLLAGLLLVIYLGSFALRTLVRRRDVMLFEVIQSAVALAIGFGGAVRVAQSVGYGGGALGSTALAAAAACYLAAFAFVDRKLGRGRNFIFYTTLAIVLLFTGSALVSGGTPLSFSWCALALAAAFLGGRYDRITLRAHSALYALAAVWKVGLLAACVNAFLASRGDLAGALAPPAFVVLAGVLLCYGVLVHTQRRLVVETWARLPRFAVALGAIMGLGALATFLLIGILGRWGLGEAIDLPVAARVTVLSLSAIALAALGRRPALPELSWPVYPVLVFGGVLLVIFGLRQGNATTLFIGCAIYGLALIVAPRLLRAAAPVEPKTADAA